MLKAEVDEALTLPVLRAGPIDLEHGQTGGKLRPTLGEGVEARSEKYCIGRGRWGVGLRSAISQLYWGRGRAR
jgi:hypothetical protein